MKNILLPIALVFMFVSSSQDLFAQTPMEEGLHNYEKRNLDFIERRLTDSSINFARLYQTAFDQLPQRKQSLHKAEDKWTPIGPMGEERIAGMGRINSMTFHPTDTNTWYICVAQGGLWKTTNAGKSWTSISGDLPILRTSCLAIHPTNPDTMYVALGDFAYLGHNLLANENKRNSHYGLGIYKSTDGGNTWTPTGLSFAQTDFEGSLISGILINQSAPNQLVAVGQTGAYSSKDGGQSWNKTHDGLFWDLDQHPTLPQVLMATTGYVHTYGIGTTGILTSTDFGATWTTSTTNIPASGNAQRIELDISPSMPSVVYAIACDSSGGLFGFYKSTNGGSSFVNVYNNQYNLLGWGFDKSLGGQGRYDLAICVDRNNHNKVLIGGVNIWQTTNGGSSFEPVTYWALNYQFESLHADIHYIARHPTNNSIFVCHDGGLSRTQKTIADKPSDLERGNSSTIWDHYTKGLNITSFYRLGINPKNSAEITAGAQDNSTVMSDGKNFYNLSGGDGMETVFDPSGDFVYTSSQYGNIYVYSRSGSYFEREPGRIYPPAGEVSEWTAPMVCNGMLYYVYGNVYRAYYTNTISTLSDFNKIPGYGFIRPGTALAVQKSNANRMYVAKRGYVSNGIENEIWTTSDEGKNWSDVSSGLPRALYPSYLEMNQRNPLQAWLTFSGFDSVKKVFTTQDAGKTWVNITHDLPNIPVNCVVHQNDGGGTIYIGTDLGVFYLEKDSTHWTYFSEGLPKVIVSELEIDENNKTLVAATFGRGLWEIGLHNFIVGNRQIRSDEVTFGLLPNPMTNVLVLSVNNGNSGTFQFKLVDITGKIVLFRSFDCVSGEEIRFDVSSLLSGLYYGILSDGRSRQVIKVMKW